MRLVAQSVSAILLLFVAVQEGTGAENYRLPTHIIPSHYSLDLIIDPESPGYSGLVEIKINAVNASDGIVRLHASAEFITLGTILLDYDASCDVLNTNEVTDIVTISCPTNTLNGDHRLTIEFEGKFSTEDMDGFYKSTYEENGEKKVLVSTQFELSSARKAFPSFDEPIFKASFDIFITHSTEYTVLTNTQVKQEYIVAGRLTKTQFETTPVMSTYLVAFVISKFVGSGGSDGEAFVFKVFSRPDTQQFTNVATTYGPSLINELSDFLGIKYTDLGNKQAYQAAIPDFSAGAMENWGLITFREVDLLDEAEKTSHSAKQRIITVVAHELSHQWFGDYVTLDWWSDTWLNEGFATYFEFHIPDRLSNENLDTAKQYVTSVVQPVLRVDSLPSSQPLTSLETDINTEREGSSKFDSISYDKGGSIVRMISYILGLNTFREGLHRYLNTYQYTNTNPSLLLTALQAQIGGSINLFKVLNNWIYKAGYPLVTVKLNEEGTSVNLTQERFVTVKNSSIEATEWYVPISYTTSDEKNFTVDIKTWLEPGSVTNIDINQDSWVIVNLQEAGFFRVNYDDVLWNRIIVALNNNTQRTQIDVLNRAQLVDDIFNIARVGQIDYEKAFLLAEFLNSETEYYPWVSALSAVSYIMGKLEDTEAEELLQKRTLGWINHAFPDISDTGMSHADMLKSVLIWDWACKLGHEVCINYATTTFESYKRTISLPDYNKRGIVFCYALRNSTNPSEDFQFLFDIFKKSKSSVEQNVIITALGCLSDETVLLQYLSETIATDSAIRKQDAASVFRAVYANSDTGVDVALTFLENNVQKIADTYKGMGALSNLINGLADRVKTEEQINRLKKIINDHDDNETINLVGKNAVDTITANKDWTVTYGGSIKDVLKKTEPSNANILKPGYMFSIIVGISVIYAYSA